MRQTKPALLIAALAAAIATAARRRQAQHDAEILWREATSDASR
ncbi:DLW-39 family protein [uncultured Jatrophihabitans sp.]